MTLTDSTVSGNTATNAGGGIRNDTGGVYNDLGTLTVVNSTVTNGATSGTGGGVNNADGTVELLNTIVANSVSGGDCSGTITSLGHNLDSDNTCGLSSTGDKSNIVAPLLGPLQDNGGPTLTHALLAGSPAIDAGDDGVLGTPHFLTTDQRGLPRLQGIHVDIGAIELGTGDPLAWGGNFDGALGNGTTTSSSIALAVSGLTGVVDVTGGQRHSLALKSDGTAWAWSGNSFGELGNGITTRELTPVQVLTDVVAVAAGKSHSLGLRSDGTVSAWGFNAHGQLGDGTTTDSDTPSTVSGLTNVLTIAAGEFHSLALTSSP